MSFRIPFNKPDWTSTELEHVTRCLTQGQSSGDGPFTKQCQQLIETRFRSGRALLTTSCTSALEMAALLCDIAPGDEVIMPSYTFVSTANAFLLRGAKPVFVDVRPDTLNLDERLVPDAITPRTKALVPVHYAGVGCEMQPLLRTAAANGLRVIEDAAQAVNATYDGKYLGTLGDFGTYSFHESKNFVCGEGGALLVNSEGLADRAEIIREKGTDRARFFRGQVDKYTWVDLGSSYVLSDILAALLLAQLQRMDEITAARRRVFETYRSALQPLVDRGLVTFPTIPAHCATNYHMFYLLVADLATRTALLEHLRKVGILAVFHYVPLHASPSVVRPATDPVCSVSESASDRIVRLPLYASAHRGRTGLGRLRGAASFFRGAASPRYPPRGLLRSGGRAAPGLAVAPGPPGRRIANLGHKTGTP
jgi:dTDP-4-amino-4,6-dideoxygalactose transaminase